jgi:mono/diheme cytochrome c family protein
MWIQLSCTGLAAVACLSLTACRVRQPGTVEATAVQWTKHHVTIRGNGQRNPIKATPENIDSGKHAFGDYCVVCHGRDGQNTGVPFAGHMSPPIPSLASQDVQRYSDGQLKWIIDNGIMPSGMPASKGTLSDEEIWQIVVYLRHLPAAGSLGEPCAYAGDEYGDNCKQPAQ